MEISRQARPRLNQKARTKAALVEAAVALLRRGAPPTVAEVADEARVSRATAYRYFPTQEALLVEIAVTPAAQPVEDMLAELPGDTDPQTRLLRLVDTFNGSVIEQEAPMRTALRVYLDTWLDNRRKADGSAPVREGRRMRWLEEVLAPARGELTAAQWKRLQAALALTLSIEPIVVMKDVCRLEDKEALAVLRWAAKALLHAALAEARAAAAQRRNKAA